MLLGEKPGNVPQCFDEKSDIDSGGGSDNRSKGPLKDFIGHCETERLKDYIIFEGLCDK